MEFAVFDRTPSGDIKLFLEHILRSVGNAYKTPFKIDENDASKIVDQKGVVFADCKSRQYAEKLFKFLKDLDAWIV